MTQTEFIFPLNIAEFLLREPQKAQIKIAFCLLLIAYYLITDY